VPVLVAAVGEDWARAPAAKRRTAEAKRIFAEEA
jgi:hypothetical protein